MGTSNSSGAGFINRKTIEKFIFDEPSSFCENNEKKVECSMEFILSKTCQMKLEMPEIKTIKM